MKRKIVVSLLSQEQEFQRMQAESARAAARGHIDLEVVYAEANAILQIHQLYGFIHVPEEERPLALIVEPVSTEGIHRVARAAVGAGIGWILLRDPKPYIEELANNVPRLAIASVSGDDVEIGRIQGRQIVALLPAGGGIVTIEGPPQHSATAARRQGMNEVLAGKNVRIEKTLVGDWGEQSTHKAMVAWFRLKTSESAPIKLVAAQNDQMAMGARKALAASRPDWLSLPLLGCDGLPEGGRKEVREGRLTATVVQEPMAGPGVELVLKAERGVSIPRRLVLSPASHPEVSALRKRTL